MKNLWVCRGETIKITCFFAFRSSSRFLEKRALLFLLSADPLSTTMKVTVVLLACFCSVVQCLKAPQASMVHTLNEVAEQTGWQIQECHDLFDEAIGDLFHDENDTERLLYLHLTEENEPAVKEILSTVPGTRPPALMEIDAATLIIGPQMLFLLKGEESSASYLTAKLAMRNDTTPKRCSVCHVADVKKLTGGEDDAQECIHCAALICNECNLQHVMDVRQLLLSGEYDETTTVPRCTVCDHPRQLTFPAHLIELISS